MKNNRYKQQPSTASKAEAPASGPDPHNESYWKSVRDAYPIEAGVIYLNNGSFGPCPQPVIDTAVRYFQKLETNPHRYIREFRNEVQNAKAVLSDFVGCRTDDIVFVTNVTFGMNMIANGLLDQLRPGDEIVTTDQEYGAIDNVWHYTAGKTGAVIKKTAIPTPPESPEQIVRLMKENCSEKTKLLVFSHITSPTGLLMPVKELCAFARENGILTAIDGAHVPGMLPLDITEIGCDFYTGNCHKWLCSPKGSGFLYASPERQSLLAPLIVGWGWFQDEETFLGNFENPGTHNPAMFIATAEAVKFQQSVGRKAILRRGRYLSSYFRSRLDAVPGIVPLTSYKEELSGFMTAVALPEWDRTVFHEKLEKAGIIVAEIKESEPFRIRVSTHIYNTPVQIDALLSVMHEIPRKS